LILETIDFLKSESRTGQTREIKSPAAVNLTQNANEAENA
jgi:hypothetical protein